MYISKRLKELRTVSGFSQEKLAELLDVSRQTISSWENERSYPDVHNLIMLCDIYSVSLNEPYVLKVKPQNKIFERNFKVVKIGIANKSIRCRILAPYKIARLIIS